MLTHVLDALRPQVEAIVVCGRSWPCEASFDDRLKSRLGPLAGLESALYHACAHNFDGVVSVPVDTLPLPSDLCLRLEGCGPAVLERQYLIGYWPSSLATEITTFLREGHRAVYHWIIHTNARKVRDPVFVSNINTLADFADLPCLTGIHRASGCSTPEFSRVKAAKKPRKRDLSGMRASARIANRLPET